MTNKDNSKPMALPKKVQNAAQKAAVECWQEGTTHQQQDWVAEEVPVALSYNGISHAVMMATPMDLEDFALGFSLSEGIVDSADEAYDCQQVTHADGLELQIRIATRQQNRLQQRRRNLQGRTGCGLCGVESLQQMQRDIAPIKNAVPVSESAVQAALQQLPNWQPLRAATGACHGAAWCSADGEIIVSREDVGRHNALDKLIGAAVKSGLRFDAGFVMVSSRASFEMVQKAAAVGIGSVVAVSAPTSLALTCAQRYGVNLIGFARPGRHCRYHSTDASP
ncbi:formate dehydrogenase accessory sulfurtransferase FdhD [Halioxenophilus aromaticivorans]|uniref:Sulfur carrier protein FdhD n=1 Tax=Halioxenophilus aromaticivorans TaxID=1306992 RepID=A0AAV3U8L1_9ALTE